MGKTENFNMKNRKFYFKFIQKLLKLKKKVSKKAL